MRSKVTRFAFSALIIAVTGLLFLAGVRFDIPVEASQRSKRQISTPSPSPTPTPETLPLPSASPEAAVTAVPLAELSIKAIELNLELRAIQDGLAKDATLTRIEDALKVPAQSAAAVKQEISMLSSQTGGLSEITDLEGVWLARRTRNAEWRKILATRTRTTLDAIQKLLTRRQEWQATLLQARLAGASEQVGPRIQSAIKDIEDTGKRATEQLNYLLGLQDKLSADDVTVLNVLDTINQEQATRRRVIWSRDTPPLWDIKAARAADLTKVQLVDNALDYNVARARDFIREKASSLSICIVVFFIALALSLKFRKLAALKAKENDTEVRVGDFVSRPFAVAFLVSFLSLLPMTSGAPVIVREILFLGLLVTTLLLLPPRLSLKFRYALYLLVAYLVVTGILDGIDLDIFVKRILLLSLNIAVIVGFVTLLRRVSKTRSAEEGSDPTFRSTAWLITGIRFAIFCAAVAAITNIFGYFRLSMLVKTAPALSAVFGAALYTGYLVVSSLLNHYFESRAHSMISLVQTHQELVLRWVRRVLAALFWIIWLDATLSFFSVAEDFWRALSRILNIELTFGSASISIENIITFIGLMAVGVFIASMLRFFLRVEVLERLNLKKGIPYAIATLTYYVLLLLVFAFALAASGVELSKLTLLTGAFGIGAGFGLQNVISNFVSGLILLFERPLRLGDQLEIGTTKGKVERIGMRSSSIRTAEGAEVIVPNSNLISQQVINWTLTRPIKRISMPLRVVQGTDPETVIKLLRDCARSHPDVLKEPPPAAFFSQFGKGSLDFELQIWILQASGDERIKSELGLRIDARLKEEGIALPEYRDYVLQQAETSSV